MATTGHQVSTIVFPKRIRKAHTYTVSNFKAFVHSLKDAGVDMSHVSISRSYALLVGLEAYARSRKRGKKIVQKLIHHRDRILSPEELARREEQDRDNCESAEREGRLLELKQQADEEEKMEENRTTLKFMEKLHFAPNTPAHGKPPDEHGQNAERIGEDVAGNGRGPDTQAHDTCPADAIAPEGTIGAAK